MVVNSFATGQCDISQQKPIKQMQREMARWKKIFKKQNPPIYYMSYSYYTTKGQFVSASLGSVHKAVFPERKLEAMVRVGSPQLDNTRELKKEWDQNRIASDYWASDGKGENFKIDLWNITQEAIDEAQKVYGYVKTEKMTTSERIDDSADFVIPPQKQFCLERELPTFDLKEIETLLADASKLVKGEKSIMQSYFDFDSTVGYRYFYDSEGTSLKTPIVQARLSYNLEGRLADGQIIERGKIYDLDSPAGIPSKETLEKDVLNSIEELNSLQQAKEAEPIMVPVILKNKAMGVFVHEVLGHRLEGHRQKSDFFGRTFTDKLGQQILPSFISIVDDPTMAYFNGEPIRGHYEFDEEGVESQKVILVENGVLKNFLMSSSPIKNFPTSNGHGRKGFGYRAVARMGNIVVQAENPVSYEELEKLLVAEVKKQNKPYGIIIEDLNGGYTFTDTSMPQSFKLAISLAYKMYPDGKKEMIRGADIAGTPLVSFAEIIAAADDYGIFNGSCGAESGWVPQSEIAPSVLLRNLEIQSQEKSVDRTPILSAPSTFENWE